MLPTVCHSKIYILPQNARTVHETFNYRDIVFVGVDVARGDGAAFTETGKPHYGDQHQVI